VAEHHRLAGAPVLVKDLRAVVGGDGAHGCSSLYAAGAGPRVSTNLGFFVSKGVPGSSSGTDRLG
jgi:hypothetical protein